MHREAVRSGIKVILPWVCDVALLPQRFVFVKGLGLACHAPVF
jgi:hypothetical protein